MLLKAHVEYLVSGISWVCLLAVSVVHHFFSAPSGNKEFAAVAVPYLGKSQQLKLIGEMVVLHVLV